MPSRYTKAVVALAAVGAISVPAVAQASHGSDDPPGHVRQEHHRLSHDGRHGSDDPSGHVRHEHHRFSRDGRHGSDDAPNHHRRGSDDGPNHR